MIGLCKVDDKDSNKYRVCEKDHIQTLSILIVFKTCEMFLGIIFFPSDLN